MVTAPEVDLLVLRHPAKSASAKVWKPVSALPRVMVPAPVLEVFILALLKSFAMMISVYVRVKIPFAPISIVKVSPSFSVRADP